MYESNKFRIAHNTQPNHLRGILRMERGGGKKSNSKYIRRIFLPLQGFREYRKVIKIPREYFVETFKRKKNSRHPDIIFHQRIKSELKPRVPRTNSTDLKEPARARACAYALAPRASFELTWTCGSTNEDAIIKGNVKCRNILRGLTHSHASPLRPIGGAFLVIATHRPTRLTGFTRVIIIYSLDLPPSSSPLLSLPSTRTNDKWIS